jgi:cell division transport system permease protein
MRIIRMHSNAIIFALKKILMHPVEHLFNLLVMIVIITMLIAIVVINKSSDFWQQNNISYPQITVYMSTNATSNDITRLELSINQVGARIIKNYEYISKQQALNDLQQQQQLKNIASDVVSQNNDNPLPDVIVVNTNSSNPRLLNQLTSKIRRMNMVGDVVLDLDYTTKLDTLISLMQNTSFIIQVFFLVIFILIIYNVIRLEMMLHQDEIMISRLIGASDSFIMRPLAYYTVIQVICATLCAYFMINYAISYFNSTIAELNHLFVSKFMILSLHLTDLIEILLVLLIFSIFGVFWSIKIVFSKEQHIV